MFDLDISKMLLVAVVALVVVGPKELPQVLRALGQVVSRLRSFQFSARKAVVDFMAEADLDGIGTELATLGKGPWTSIASNPATAMRGTLPALQGGTTGASASRVAELHYSSPEMEAYLSPSSESFSNTEELVGKSGGTPGQSRLEDVVISGSIH